MRQRLIRAVTGLPDNPLDAAAHFGAKVLPDLRTDMAKAGEVVILFEPADHTHDAWRLSSVQGLAREAAPLRVNAVVSADYEAIQKATDYLASASGVTGQILTLHGNPGKQD